MADFTEKNRQVFEKMAGSYMNDFAQIIQNICKQVQNRRLWISDKWTDTEAGKGKELKMLEYACGPGAISATLAPFVAKIVGLDISDNMVSEYNKNAERTGFSDKMAAQKGDLFADTASTELSGPEFSDFDIVVVSMALHHFDDAGKAVRCLGDRLKKGGVCVIVDLVPEHSDELHHGAHKGFDGEAAETVKTHGFTREEMKGLLADAGLVADFGYQVVDEPAVLHKDGKRIEKTLFVAKAQRA